MVRSCAILLTTLAILGLAQASAWAQDKKDDGKGTVVDFDGLKSRAPSTWKEEKPTNQMRFMQFRLPRAKDDKADAELIIFRGLGGSAQANVDRWKAQFIPPEGKKIDDVAKVQDMKVGPSSLTYLDIQGTYLYKERPFDPSDKGEKRPNYRMLAVHYEGPKNVYHIRLIGPARTIEEHKKGFDEWLKSFK